VARDAFLLGPRTGVAREWTEAVTRIGGGVSDGLYAGAREQFSEKELVDLTWAVVATNAWNRIAISFRSVPGEYQPTRLMGLPEDSTARTR
jgi:alkylhydroperoxidase family enzyme